MHAAITSQSIRVSQMLIHGLRQSNFICYHKVRETVAAGIFVVYKEGTETNLDEILTKLPPPYKRLDRVLSEMQNSGNDPSMSFVGFKTN
jgi:transcription initiation factor IIE alpha subunit